jgi:hypothetical protein
VVERHDRPVRHDVARHTTLDEDRLQGLVVSTAVDHRPARHIVVQRRQHTARAVQRIATHPRAGDVGPQATQFHPHTHGALASDLEGGIGGLAQDRGVAGHEIGPLGEQMAEAIVIGGHLLAGVEDPGDVDRRVGDGRRQLEHDRQSALHVGGAQPPQHVVPDLGCAIVVRRNRVEVTRDHQPDAPTGRRPRHDVVTEPVDAHMAQRPEPCLDVVRQRRLVVALGRDGNQIGGSYQQVRHARRLGPADAASLSPGAACRAYRGPP